MRSFFQSVLKHIDRLDAGKLREQYRLVTDENEALGRILEMTDRGIVSLDASGDISYANPAAKSLLGPDVERALDTLGVAPGVALKVETSVDYPEARTLEIRTLPSERITLVYIRDTTAEKKRTEEELRAGATKAVCDLAAGVAHEIGNPLNAISLNLQLMDRSVAGLPEGPDREDLAESLRISRDEVSRLDGLLRNSLNALRGGAPNLVPCDVLAVLQRALGTLRADIQEHGVSVDVAAPARLPPIPGDAEQLQQVFFNLVKNAVQAMSEGGRLAIALSADDRDLTVAFRDTGSGIAPEDFRRLFEPFHTTKSGGHGIGLAVVKRIVDAHGGRIDVSSKPGEGTCFRLVFPLATRRARRLPPPPAAR